jgi:uncharacterized protein with PQ loop repeat
MNLETIIGVIMCISPFMYLTQVHKASKTTESLSLWSLSSQIFFMVIYLVYFFIKQDIFLIINQIVWLILVIVVIYFVIRDKFKK